MNEYKVRYISEDIGEELELSFTSKETEINNKVLFELCNLIWYDTKVLSIIKV